MGKINVYDKLMIENQKKRKYGNSQLTRASWCQRERWHHIGLHMWRISLVCGAGIVVEVKKYVTHRIFNANRQYILVFDW